MELRLRPETLSVCRLAAGTPVPPPPDDGSLYSASTSGLGADHEQSLVCRADLAPSTARVETGWRALTVAGPLEFALIGVVAGLTTPLAAAGVSVFVVSTYDTDHLLVRADSFELAVSALTEAGHAVTRQ